MSDKASNTTTEQPEPEGFNCKNPKCKTRHQFGVYVMAHWNEELIHTCEKCGQKHTVRAGKVRKYDK